MATTQDTNALLQAGLTAAEQWDGLPAGSAAERAAAETMSGVLILLHRALRAGGHLPAAWCNAQPPVPIGATSGAAG